MAALALGRRPDPASLIASFSGSHRFVVDFSRARCSGTTCSPPVPRRRRLDRLTADLCAAVTDRADNQRLLEEINGKFVPGPARRQARLVALPPARRHSLFVWRDRAGAANAIHRRQPVVPPGASPTGDRPCPRRHRPNAAAEVGRGVRGRAVPPQRARHLGGGWAFPPPSCMCDLGSCSHGRAWPRGRPVGSGAVAGPGRRRLSGAGRDPMAHPVGRALQHHRQPPGVWR